MIQEIWGHLTGVLIVVMMVTFVCIWAWAWSGHHKRTFSRMAELPMEDDGAINHDSADTNARDAQP